MNTSLHTELLSTPKNMVGEMIVSPTGMVKVLAPHRYHDGDSRLVAHALKTNDATAVQQAAEAMLSIIRSLDNVALVPVPSHLGYATYTLELARAIGVGQVFDVLRGKQRETLYAQKKRGETPSSSTLGFYAIGSIPEDMNIVYLDNVVATGTTAKAAYEAIGRGLMVAYAIDC